MTMLEAICAPRISAPSGTVEVSNRIPAYVTDGVEATGYRVQRSHRSYAFAAVHGVIRDGERLTGGADPQRDGTALLA
jgi:gamma-glutamyltranspeptidase/glutathione hydrolase